MKRLIAVSFSIICISASAQDVCTKIADPTNRLKCFDDAAEKSARDAEAKIKKEKSEQEQKDRAAWKTQFKLRSDGDLSNMGNDPASLSTVRTGGDSATVVKAALVWEYQPTPESNIFGTSILADYGWAPFAYTSINKNTLSSKYIDTRAVGVGIHGNVFRNNNFSLFSTFRLDYQDDNKQKQESVAFKFDNVVVSDLLIWGKPFNATTFGLYAYPNFGLLLQDFRNVPAGQVSGKAEAGYVGARLDYYPGYFLDRLKVSGQVRRFRDLSVDTGMLKRGDTFRKATIEWLLYDPRPGTTNTFLPSIALERTTGADLLNAIPAINITQLQLRLKLN